MCTTLAPSGLPKHRSKANLAQSGLAKHRSKANLARSGLPPGPLATKRCTVYVRVASCPIFYIPKWGCTFSVPLELYYY